MGVGASKGGRFNRAKSQTKGPSLRKGSLGDFRLALSLLRANKGKVKQNSPQELFLKENPKSKRAHAFWLI